MLATESEKFLEVLGAEAVTYRKWSSPTGHNDPDDKWSNEANVYIEDTALYAEKTVGGVYWLELTRPDSIICNGVRFFVSSEITVGSRLCQAAIYYNGQWNQVYTTIQYLQNQWTEVEFSAQETSQARIFVNTSLAGWCRIHEFDFLEARSINAIINRRPAAQIAFSQGHAPLLEITVANDSTIGISSDEINLGKDLINLPVRLSETAQDRRIAKILSMDSGMMKLEVR